ncbi:MAG: hypothetical protein KKE23_01860 [Nanoarchaeota archaeon]|nr:hypothetical protein [Nanoarchaeota archaeon]
MEIQEMKLIYPAFSKHLFYFKDHISKFVLEKGYVPLNPFNIHGYFMLDTLPRDLIRCSNNNLVKRADGVLFEIRLAKEYNKPIRYFEVIKSKEIMEITKEQLKFEDGLERFLHEL